MLIYILTEEFNTGAEKDLFENMDILRNYGTMNWRIADNVPVDAGFSEGSNIRDGGRDTSQ